MKGSTFALLLLLFTFAAQGTWCAATAERRSTMVDAARHHLRPHLQVQGFHGVKGKKLLEIQSPRKLGAGHMGGGGGRNTGGGAANTRPHNNKNGVAAALPAPVTSILALVISSAILLSALI